MGLLLYSNYLYITVIIQKCAKQIIPPAQALLRGDPLSTWARTCHMCFSSLCFNKDPDICQATDMNVQLLSAPFFQESSKTFSP